MKLGMEPGILQWEQTKETNWKKQKRNDIGKIFFPVSAAAAKFPSGSLPGRKTERVLFVRIAGRKMKAAAAVIDGEKMTGPN